MESYSQYLENIINEFMEMQQPNIKMEKMKKHYRNIQRRKKAIETFKNIITYIIAIAFIFLIASADSIAEMI